MRELIALGLLALLVLGLAYAIVRYAEHWWRDSEDVWPAVARVLRGRNRDGLRPERVALVLVQSLAALGAGVALAICGADVLPSLVVLYFALALITVDATRGEPRAHRIRSGVLGVLALALALGWIAFCAQWDFSGSELLAAFAATLGALLGASMTGWADGLAHRWTVRAQDRRRPMPS